MRRMGVPIILATTALVLTGVTTRDELSVSPVKPDGVYEDLVELVAAWR